MDIRLLATANTGTRRTGWSLVGAWLLWSLAGFLYWVAIIAAVQFVWRWVGGA